MTFVNGCGVSKKKEETPSLSKADYAYILKFHEGIRYKSKGLMDEALATFKECHALRPNDDAVCYALSELYLVDGNKLKAGEFISKAAQLDPKNSHYTMELAYFQYDSGAFKDVLRNPFKNLLICNQETQIINMVWQNVLCSLGNPKKPSKL